MTKHIDFRSKLREAQIESLPPPREDDVEVALAQVSEINFVENYFSVSCSAYSVIMCYYLIDCR